MKRIGLFGGTFNPIHNGHLRAATSVLEGFGLDSLVMIPAAMPPHKPSKNMASAADRLEMTRLAAADFENLVVSDVELVRSGPSYTIDTARYFHERFDADTQLFFILGADAFLEIDTWKDFEELFFSIPMIVLDRPGGRRDTSASFSQEVETFLIARISENYVPAEDGLSFSHPRRQTVYLFPGQMMDVSSTWIRDRVGRGEMVTDAVPRKVEDFIRRKGLYR